MKKFLAGALSAILFLSMLLPVGATGNQAVAFDADDSIIVAGEEFSKSELITEISNEDLFISEDVAQEIALLFLTDAMHLDNVSWNNNTLVMDVVPMYDETGSDCITAYTIELTSGYIVISAYLDAANLVLEWSDAAPPVYKLFDMDSADQIVYLGALNYYKDTGNAHLETLDGTSVSRADTHSPLEETRDFANIPDAALVDIAQKNILENRTLDTIGHVSLRSSAVTDPYTHANNNYAGPFVYSDHINKWDSYIKYKRTTDFSTVNGTTYYNHCGPTAYVNILLAYAHRYNNSKIKNTAHSDLFRMCAASSPWYVNSSGPMGGSLNVLTNANIIQCFSSYGVDKRDQVKGIYNITYNNVKSSLNANSLLLVMLMGHDYYGDHQILAFAYTRLKSSNTGAYKTYLKVADGWSSSARYLDLATATSDQYWEVKF